MALATSTWKSRCTLGSDHFGVSNGAQGSATRSGCSSVRNASMGRHWVVPWMRIPAVSTHQVSARARQSARSTKVSPAKKLCWT